jgi:hypothetical protein
MPDVRFPDVDAPMLHELVGRVKDQYLAVVQAEVVLKAAQQALDDEHENVLKKAHRLHAWLTVMAEADEVLALKLESVSLPRLRKVVRSESGEGSPVEEPVPKKRGRTRKGLSGTEALFDESLSSGESERAAP